MKKKILILTIIISILLIFSILVGCYYLKQKDESSLQLQEDSIIESDNDQNEDEEYISEIIEDITVNDVEPEIASTEKEEPKINQEVTTTSTTKQPSTVAKTPTTQNTSTSTQTQTTKNNNSKSNQSTTTSNKQTTPSTSTTQSVETKHTETPTRCTNNNNHGMDVGNSGQWFSSKNEAIAYYNSKVSYWSNLWETDQIDDATYYKNCPTGYETWSCMYCSKWTINFYYR